MYINDYYIDQHRGDLLNLSIIQEWMQNEMPMQICLYNSLNN
jgi:hypothetical protein